MSTLKELILKKDELNNQAAKILADHIGLNALDAEIRDITKQINFTVDAAVKAKMADAKKDTGTVNIPHEGVLIKSTISKTVKWDQAGLCQMIQKISDSGDNPADYVEVSTEYRISEDKFKCFSDAIKNAFMPFREVKTGKPRIELKIIEEATSGGALIQ